MFTYSGCNFTFRNIALMKIAINDRRKIYAIQEEFSSQFPYLKLGFLSKPNTRDGHSSEKPMKAPDRTLGDFRTTHENGIITITPTLTVSELVQRFSDVYGLHVRLLRKSGNVWLETSVTDAWTLEEQNRQGEALSSLSTRNRS
jgi:hypothetical protein